MNFPQWNEIDERLFIIESDAIIAEKQALTNDAFSEKWSVYSAEDECEQEKIFEFQKGWFLTLYGFNTEAELAKHLSRFEWILDAGCGIGFKSAWFAALAPNSKVIGIDYSDAVYVANRKYSSQYPNLYFAKGDIAQTKLPAGIVDFTVCDQVIMHTENPTETLRELARITASDGEICCYWYRKKALPRELLDEHFRSQTASLSNEQLWKLSEEVLALGKMLSELNIEADFPSLPSFGIEGGKMNLQRFIYWNFIKCFWNEKLGYATSLNTNFDWYSPANAKRFSKEDVMAVVAESGLIELYFHEEEACYSGRFSHRKNV